MSDKSWADARQYWEDYRYQEEVASQKAKSKRQWIPDELADALSRLTFGLFILLVFVGIPLAVGIILGLVHNWAKAHKDWQFARTILDIFRVVYEGFWPAVVGGCIASYFWLNFWESERRKQSSKLWKLEQDHANFIQQVNKFGGTPREYKEHLSRQYKSKE